MTMRTQYIASSLEDIAEHFDHLCYVANDKLPYCAKKEEARYKAEVDIWSQAAAFLRTVKLEIPEEEE